MATDPRATDGPPQTTQATLAAEGRDQASVLLHALMNDRRIVEERCAESGKGDPLKALTGRSSLDRAIVSTREILTRMDDLLAEMKTQKTNGISATTNRVAETAMPQPSSNGS